MKNIKYCPVCGVKKIIHSFQINHTPENSYNNGVALTPPMGWSSWNLFRYKINENLMKQIADAMVASGLRDAGYTYVNIDDCWQSTSRDENGRLVPDKLNFPSGMKQLSKYVTDKGLKLGIYSSNGTLTCEDYPASLYHEAVDADTFADWGIEYFKYDFCHNKPVPSNAPLIVKIDISDEKDIIHTAYAKDAVLSGNARTVKYDNIDGGLYIKGLSSHTGEAVFEHITVPKTQSYVLTFTIKKEGLMDKFMVVDVNGEEEYHLRVPGTLAFSPEGKVQVDINLKEGENSIRLFNPIGSRMDSSAFQYINMGKELKRATREKAERDGTPEKPICYSICEWGFNRPWRWGRQAGNLWRTTPDIKPFWISILAIYEATMKLSKYAGVGGWNDPDMLEVGNGELTYEENKSHFSLWCMMSSPLILGNDIRTFVKPDGTIDKDNKVYQILTNPYLISIDQDRLGIPCKKINNSHLLDVLVKPLDNCRAAVCIFNKDAKNAKTQVPLKNVVNMAGVNVPLKDNYTITNCWTGESFTGDVICAEPEKHGVEVYIVE